ncbi:collagen, putative, partial [Ixodes scapularis]
TCTFEGTKYSDGDEWHPDPCTTCKCLLGSTICDTEECREVDCKTNQYIPLGKCCPVCPGKCQPPRAASLKVTGRTTRPSAISKTSQFEDSSAPGESSLSSSGSDRVSLARPASP